MSITYTKVGWKNNQTPLNESNLNQMDNGIFEVTNAVSVLQTRVEELDSTTAGNDSTIGMTFDSATGKLKFENITV